MKDGNRSKAGKSGAGLGEKSEIKANAGIRVNNENRSKAKKEAGVRGEMEISVCAGNEKIRGPNPTRKLRDGSARRFRGGSA